MDGALWGPALRSCQGIGKEHHRDHGIGVGREGARLRRKESSAQQASAAQALALIQQAEGWSVGNVLGALTLGTLIVVLIGYALSVTVRR